MIATLKPTSTRIITLNIIKRFLRDEHGATAIEYGLIAAGIALAIVAGVQGAGSQLSQRFGDISTSLK